VDKYIRWLVSNWWLKLLSFFLSLIIWFSVTGQKKVSSPMLSEKSFSRVKIRVLTEPRPLLKIELVPSYASLVIKGESSLINKVSKEDIILFVDVAGLREGEYDLPVSSRLPAEVTLMSLKPSHVKVNISPLLSKREIK